MNEKKYTMTLKTILKAQDVDFKIIWAKGGVPSYSEMQNFIQYYNSKIIKAVCERKKTELI